MCIQIDNLKLYTWIEFELSLNWGWIDVNQLIVRYSSYTYVNKQAHVTYYFGAEF